MELIIATIVALLPIINPFSTAPLFLAMTERDTEAERNEQARRGVIYMVIILTSFLVGGSFIMSFFGLLADSFPLLVPGQLHHDTFFHG